MVLLGYLAISSRGICSHPRRRVPFTVAVLPLPPAYSGAAQKAISCDFYVWRCLPGGVDAAVHAGKQRHTAGSQMITSCKMQFNRFINHQID